MGICRIACKVLGISTGKKGDTKGEESKGGDKSKKKKGEKSKEETSIWLRSGLIKGIYIEE
jgi:hypothetical protein